MYHVFMVARTIWEGDHSMHVHVSFTGRPQSKPRTFSKKTILNKNWCIFILEGDLNTHV